MLQVSVLGVRTSGFGLCLKLGWASASIKSADVWLEDVKFRLCSWDGKNLIPLIINNNITATHPEDPMSKTPN